MNAEIITIGNEILYGHTIDTNSAYMGRRLAEVGIPVLWRTSVGDNRERICEAFSRAMERCEVVLVTGGLGPTHDDITKTVFCEVFDRKLVLDESVLDHVRYLFTRRGLTMPEVNIGQAMIPEGAQVIHNPIGTAPGIYLTVDDRHIFLMPGVPREMTRMMEEGILPILSRLVGGRRIVHHRTFRTTGIGESALFEKIRSMDGLDRIASLPSLFGVDLRITVQGTERVGVEAEVERIAGELRRRVGEYLYGMDDETLEKVVGRELKQRGLRIAVAESCTGGVIADRLTNVPGSSDYTKGGVIAYHDDAKVQLLRVPADLIQRHGPVSREVAEAMAAGVQRVMQVEIGLATTGVLGPTGGTPETPVGTVYIGLAVGERVTSQRLQLGDERLPNKTRASQAALEMVRRTLLV
jgi:nicotinamide-nucleotide amidase